MDGRDTRKRDNLHDNKRWDAKAKDSHHHGGGGGEKGHRHHPGGHGRPQAERAEDVAMKEAEAAAAATGVHHQHFVNRGLDAEHDVKVVPPPPEDEAGAAKDVKPSSPAGPPPPPVLAPAPKFTSSPATAAIEAAIREGTHVIGRLVLPKAWTNGVAFVKNPNLFPWDVFVGGVDNRGNALPGDIVVVELKPQSEWKAANREGTAEGHVATLGGRRRNNATASGDGAAAAEEPVARLADGRVVQHVVDHASKSREQDDAERLTRSLNGKTDFADWPRALQPEGRIVLVLERRFEPLQCCRLFQSAAPPPAKPAEPEVGAAAVSEPAPVAAPAAPAAPPAVRIVPDRWYRFKSYRDDFPIVAIYGRDIPTNFRDDVASFLFLVVIDPSAVTFVDGRFPVGKVHAGLGQTGTVDAESAAISYSHKVKDAPFSDEVEDCVVRDFVIPSKDELKEMGRRDLRDEEFVCTIDPATARDLDDALSITKIRDGYRVGVHIADVSHFVPVDTLLDQEARLRATSTYYIERVIPMLPRRLCEDYCSLNAGVDKFAFSGIWHFDYDGNVKEEWFGQSVIRNRCRMAYEDAQYIIDGDESGDSLNFVNEEEPREELVKRVVKSVKLLQELALKLKARRFERGALSLNKGKLKFIFEDFNSRLAPKGLTQERSKAANFLVEEFMLHANCRVGEKVVQYMPECALLRKHDPPIKKKLNNFVEAAKRFGFDINASSSKTLRDTLQAYADHPDIDCLRFMATICMSLAKYTSSGADQNAPISHFALAAPIYTHFTSPIRRYADLVIHRQLLLALDIEHALQQQGYTDAFEAGRVDRLVDIHDLPHSHYYVHPADVETIAAHCNDRKEAAKKAGDASIALFLCLYIRALAQKSKIDARIPEKLVVRAVVVRIEEQRFTLYLTDIAMTFEVFHNSPFQVWQGENKVEKDMSGFIVNWGPHPSTKDVTTEKLTLFSQVLVTLDAVVRGHMELQATVHPPWQRDPSRMTPLDLEL